MAETKAQQVIEARHSNVLPLPTATTPAQEAVPQTFTTKDLQKRYNVSNKQVRNYASTIKDAYPWLSEELKAGNKYTELMVQLIDEFKASSMSASQWIEHIHDENVDKLQVHEVEVVEQSSGVEGWLNESALAVYNESQEATNSLATYDYQQTSYLTIGQQSLADSQAKLATSRTQSFDLSNRLLTQLSLLSQDKQQQEVARQQEITADIDSYALQQAHIQLAKILKGEQLASEVDALYRKGVSPEEIGKMLNGLQSANFNGDVEHSGKKS
ncbi:MAG: hypothetical protein F6K41_43165 [Symploca sp. SIO3E6]|nr:hypothetical protein [Symploca sp. SIO2C1]NES25522.1 hypothetical protein [Caldora sp. SIO3E6]